MWFSTPSVSSIGFQQQAHIFAPRGWIRGSSHTCHQTDIWTGSESSTAHLGHILYILMAKNGHTNLNTTQTATPRPSAPDSRISHADITFFGPSMRSHQWLYFFAHDSDSETGRLSLAACPGSRVQGPGPTSIWKASSPPKSSQVLHSSNLSQVASGI